MPSANVRSPRDLIGGGALLVFALAALVAIRDLEVGELARMGPGYLPLVMCIIIGTGGLILAVRSFVIVGPTLERWNLTNLALVLGAVVIFGAALRPLGLGLATLMLAFVAGLASPTRRIGEVLLLSGALAAIALLLFPIALGVSVPLWPAL